MKLKPRNPRTPGEWQDAVDAAHALRLLHDARLYGLVTGGPIVNTERCDEILDAGKARAILPRPDAVERWLAAVQARVEPPAQNSVAGKKDSRNSARFP